MHTPTRQSGFSLIELLLVVAIIGIISAIAIPSLAGARAAAEEASAISMLRLFATDQNQHLVQYGRYGRIRELDQRFHDGRLGAVNVGLQRQKYRYVMNPIITPTDAQLQPNEGYKIMASGVRPDGSAVVYQVDHSSEVTRYLP